MKWEWPIFFREKPKEDNDELEKIVQKEEKDEGIPKKLKFILEKEVSFHGKLYAMSNNFILQRFHGMPLPVFKFVNKQP